MRLLRWIWAYLFDCVHFHTTWPHQDRFGHAYVCCIDCGREMPYSVEYMRIVRTNQAASPFNADQGGTVTAKTTYLRPVDHGLCNRKLEASRVYVLEKAIWTGARLAVEMNIKCEKFLDLCEAAIDVADLPT